MDEIEELAGDVLTYLGFAEGAELLIAGHRGRMRDIHMEKLPYELGRLADIHPEKLPFEYTPPSPQLLRGQLGAGGWDWIRVDERFANFYMTLLASRLADRVGAGLLTSLAAAEQACCLSEL